MSRVYAYVTFEQCTPTRVVLPGTEVNGTPVSRHGDYYPWRYGKRETLAIAKNHESEYKRHAAWEVACLLGWDEED